MKKLGKNLKGKTIAVFGASSNIGSKFVQDAAKRGATVIAVARNVSKVPIGLENKSSGHIEVIQGDITVKKDVYGELDRIGCIKPIAIQFIP